MYVCMHVCMYVCIYVSTCVLKGLALPRADYERITSIDPAQWQQELDSHAQLFDQLKHGLPAALLATRQKLVERLA